MMVDVSTIALSGFNASQTRLSVAANNIANGNTPNFRAQDVVQTSDAAGGVSAEVVTSNPPVPSATQTAANDSAQASNVEVDQELVKANFATYSAQANLKVLKTQDKMNEYLLDIQA